MDTVGLILHYKLWAGFTSTSKVFDYSLQGNQGSSSGTDISAKWPGFDFNGSDDYIDTGATFQSTFRSDFTLSAWVKPDDGIPTSTTVVLGSRNATVQDVILFSILSATGKLRIGITSNNNEVNTDSTNAVFSNGQEDWHHIAAVVDETAQTATLYADGENVGSGSIAALTQADFTTDQNIWVGGANNNGAIFLPYAGLVDEVMMFNVTKTAAEIKNIYSTTRKRYSI